MSERTNWPGSDSFGSLATVSRRNPASAAIVALAGALALVSVATASASGQTADSQGGMAAMRTAAQQAGLAARARKLADAREHLQHVLNCLEGPQGPDYRAVAGNPCTGAGAEQGLPAGSANQVPSAKGDPAGGRRRGPSTISSRLT